MMDQTTRTDLAIERMPSGRMAKKLDGADVEVEHTDGCKVTDVDIRDDRAVKAIGKPIGRYITVEPQWTTSEASIAHVLGAQIKKLLGSCSSVLVAGLGNRQITPDSIGARVVDGIEVTRVLYDSVGMDARVEVSAVATGVLGDTGIETLEILAGICDRVQPEAVIAVDALCARDVERISNTFQLTDTGISPGAGVGNLRKRIDRETLGRTVIGIGVPTVVYAGTVCRNMLEKLTDDSDAIGKIIEEATGDAIGELVVTPKDIDAQAERAARIISAALNEAFDVGEL